MNLFKNLSQKSQPFFLDKTSQVPYYRRAVEAPAKKLSCFLSRPRARIKASQVDSKRNDAMRPDSILFFKLSLCDGSAGRNPARAARKAIAFDPIEWGRIPLRPVLKREKDQRSFARRPPRNLCRRKNERFLPAMNQVPILAKELRETGSIEEHVRRPAAISWNRLQLAHFTRRALKLDVTKISLERRGSGNRNVPALTGRTGKFIREAPVQRHAV